MAEMKPSDMPLGSKVEVTIEDGRFAVYFFFAQDSRVYDGFATGTDLQETVLAAMADAD